MLSRVFPRQFDNFYSGQWLAIWMLAPILLFRTITGFYSMLMTRPVAEHADGIPLASFDPAGAAMVVLLFAHLGLFFFLFGLLGLVVLFRYRAMIPLIYLLILLEQLGNKVLQVIYPTTPTGAASPHTSSLVVLAILGLAIVGFVLSLTPSPSRTQKIAA